MKIIQFSKNSSPYNAGDIAGFEDVVADRHLDNGVANLYVAPGDEPEPKKATKKASKKKASKKTSGRGK